MQLAHFSHCAQYLKAHLELKSPRCVSQDANFVQCLPVASWRAALVICSFTLWGLNVPCSCPLPTQFSFQPICSQPVM